VEANELFGLEGVQEGIGGDYFFGGFVPVPAIESPWTETNVGSKEIPYPILKSQSLRNNALRFGLPI
jgi:hypothetical protein